jgi:hypothetical protein
LLFPMTIDLLRVAAEQGLTLTGHAGAHPRWRTRCPRCASWLDMPARAPARLWLFRRVCAFAARHGHRRRGGVR